MGKLTGKTARQEAPMSEIWNADSKGGWCFGEVASSSPLHKIWILESEARAPEAFFLLDSTAFKANDNIEQNVQRLAVECEDYHCKLEFT